MPRLVSALFLLLPLLPLLGCRQQPDDGFNRGGERPVDDDEGALSGRVCAPNGDAVLSARVLAERNAALEAEVETDESGLFTFADLPSGTYVLTAEKGSWSVSTEVDYVEGTVVDVGDLCLDPSSVRTAVITGRYDSIGTLIQDLGFSVDLVDAVDSDAYLNLLLDPEALAEYDVLFFNCGMSESWGGQSDAVGANLDAFVAAGGSLYASDLAFPVLEAARPDFLDMVGPDTFEGPRVGQAATVQATVLDPALAEFFGGREAEITYDLGGWAVLESVGNDAEVIATGSVSTFDGQTLPNAPLVASMGRPGEGRMVFTTFHNEAQITADMEAILFELILKL